MYNYINMGSRGVRIMMLKAYTWIKDLLFGFFQIFPDLALEDREVILNGVPNFIQGDVIVTMNEIMPHPYY